MTNKMISNIVDIAINEFQKNEQNFFMRLREIIIDDESLLDETSKIKVYFNFHEDGFIYFRFDVETCRTVFLTDYYRSDYNFEIGQKNNTDEILSNQEDIEIFTFFGDDISNQNHI